MPDCPYELRGFYYPSHLKTGCTAYHKCPVCSMCQNYDKHSAMCGNCEARKPKAYRICICSSRAKEIKKHAEEVFGRPLFDMEGLDRTGFNVSEDQSYMEVGKELEELSESIDHKLGYVPGLAQSQQVSEDTSETVVLDHEGRSYVV